MTGLLWLDGHGMDAQDELRRRIAELEMEHRDLDDVLAKVAEFASFDQIQIQRLKKRKLLLKDEIAHMRSRLVPDIIA